VTLLHESKFTTFLRWAEYPRSSEINTAPSLDSAPYAIQFVRQVNYGPLESKRYFVVNEGGSEGDAFVEVSERWLIDANFQKLNT
jgi:hypothetical protein